MHGRLTRERLIDPEAVPDDALGAALVLLYKGTVADARGSVADAKSH